MVAYATKYGSTKEIAEKIGEVLIQSGLQADVMQISRVNDLTPYTAVVVGSAVYIGNWRKEAVKFMKKNAQALTARPVWIFSSGPAGEGDPVELLKGWRFPTSLQPSIDQIKPRDIAVFHGNVQVEKMSFLEKWMIRNVKSPVGDFRQWDDITAWATSIVNALAQK